jgi:hypothetical protein
MRAAGKAAWIAAACGGTAMLIPAGIYNIAPNVKSAWGGNEAALALVSLQIAAVIMLATLPRKRGYWGVILVLIVFSMLAAFKTANHNHEDETKDKRAGIAAKAAIDGKLTDFYGKRGNYPKFTSTSQQQADAAVTTYNDAAAARKNCWQKCEGKEKDERDARGKMEATLAQRTLTADFEKLTTDIEKNETDLRKLGYVPAHADTVDARLAELFSHFWLAKVSDEAAANVQIIFFAFVVEILNRYGPTVMFAFIFGLLGDAGVEAKPETANAVADDPAPPPTERKRTRKTESSDTSGNVVSLFRQRPTAEQIHALAGAGKTQKQIGAHFGYSERTIRNILQEEKRAA